MSDDKKRDLRLDTLIEALKGGLTLEEASLKITEQNTEATIRG